MRTAKPTRRGGGFTLIELLVAISLLTVLLPIAGWTVFLLLRAQTASADALADDMTLSRFARTFRADVHAARSAEVNGDHSRPQRQVVLRLNPPRTISYAADRSGLIVRTIQNGTRIERREEFRLAGTRTQFALVPNEGTLAALYQPRSLTISGAPVIAATPSTIRMEAVVGRDHRFEQAARAVSNEPPPPPLPKKPVAKGKH